MLTALSRVSTLRLVGHGSLCPGPVFVVWAREEKLMPLEHAERLAEHFENADLVWIDDSRTLTRSTSLRSSSTT